METFNVTDPFGEFYLELNRFTGEKKVVELMETYNVTGPFRELYLELI